MLRFSKSIWAVSLVLLGICLLGLAAPPAAQATSEQPSPKQNAASSPAKSSPAKPTESPPAAKESAEPALPAPGATPRAGSPSPESKSPAAPEASRRPAAEKEGGKTPSVEAEAPLDGAAYQIRLRDLEQRIDELKEQVRRSHARLSLLTDTLLSGGNNGARAEIVFVNELSSVFKVVEVVFVLDGAVQYRKEDETGILAAQEMIPIFSGSLPAGDHTLQVAIKLRGHGYGVFSYLSGYRFDLPPEAFSFTVTDGQMIEVRAIARERGGATTPLGERPSLHFATALRSIGEWSVRDSSESQGAARGARGAGAKERASGSSGGQ